MSLIIDASQPCGAKAQALAVAGVKTVIRYYSRNTLSTSKRLTEQEAARLTDAGLRLGAVHEQRLGNKLASFDAASGAADGAYARHYAASVIRQPGGTAIYFAVDLDVNPSDIEDRILPYFKSVAAALAAPSIEPRYAIGVYGSGLTCAAILGAGLASYTWLAQATGWRGYKEFKASGRWSMLQAMPTDIAGIECDPNEAGASGDIGDFSLPGGTLAAAVPLAASVQARSLFVNARNGLRLRGGPGVQFDILKSLPFGTALASLKSSDGWAMVDLHGDGVADGFVSSAYLADALTPATLRSAATTSMHTEDAIHVAALVQQGSSENGLKAARITAEKAWKDYPHNGCAAHLSALLEHAGIDVPMTLGAGKLAHILIDRGWSKIGVGDQIPGDIGVCYDRDPSPAGADHIYLVVKTIDRDEMLIADNQNGDVNAPHARFATGHGTTSTEYFLRAV
ncbi:MAG TPA: glycoside hydrolase domain-containing protein [Kaistia sp.]|nr:glycoside hydrolase domain-containing protein [Kaistia sp.]